MSHQLLIFQVISETQICTTLAIHILFFSQCINIIPWGLVCAHFIMIVQCTCHRLHVTSDQFDHSSQLKSV